MTTYELIAKKRDGLELSPEEINHIIQNYTSGELPDYQMAALSMAIYINGMSVSETAALTNAMVESGERVIFEDQSHFYVDKHSTGGVGDKVSLILAPLVASLGIKVPMIAGRGLGHTGGTLDKLEAIPGFNVNLSLKEFKEAITTYGCCIIGQTKEIAPADKKLYALRDVTATVSSIPLITGSIMSKKIAEGINGLVMDLKFGNGAFMKTEAEAIELATSIVQNGERNNVRTIAYLTNMSEPLGKKIGNWLEIEEVLDALNGRGPADLMRVTHLLSAEMILMAGKAQSFKEALQKSIGQIENGQALQFFRDLVIRQGGDLRALSEAPESLIAPIQIEITSPESGYVTEINTLEIGLLSVAIGGGRNKSTDAVDHRVGIDFKISVGDKINKDDVIAILHLADDVERSTHVTRLINAVRIGKDRVEPSPLLASSVSSIGVKSTANELALLLELIN